jgi:hypothetical protein
VSALFGFAWQHRGSASRPGACSIRLLLRLKLFGYCYPIEITLIRDNLIPLNPNDGSSRQGQGASGRFTTVGSLAGIGALHSPMMSNHPWLNFTSIEQLDVKVGEGRPQSFYMCGKSFSADAGISPDRKRFRL